MVRMVDPALRTIVINDVLSGTDRSARNATMHARGDSHGRVGFPSTPGGRPRIVQRMFDGSLDEDLTASASTWPASSTNALGEAITTGRRIAADADPSDIGEAAKQTPTANTAAP